MASHPIVLEVSSSSSMSTVIVKLFLGGGLLGDDIFLLYSLETHNAPLTVAVAFSSSIFASSSINP